MGHSQPATIFGIAASSSAQRAFPFLTVLVLAPAGAALIVLLVPKSVKVAVRTIGIVTTLGVLALAAVVFGEFHSGVGGLQMSSVHPWVQSLGISWSLGVDGISLFLVVMSALLFPIALLGTGERENEKSFTIWMLLLESACLGSFLSTGVMCFFLS